MTLTKTPFEKILRKDTGDPKGKTLHDNKRFYANTNNRHAVDWQGRGQSVGQPSRHYRQY